MSLDLLDRVLSVERRVDAIEKMPKDFQALQNRVTEFDVKVDDQLERININASIGTERDERNFRDVKESISYIQRQMEYGFEVVDSQLELLAQDRVEIEASLQRIADTELSAITLGDTVTNISGDVASILTQIGTINGNVGSILTQIGTINGSVGTISTNINSIIGSIGQINTTIGTINGNIGSIEISIGNVSGRINTLEANISNVGTAVFNLQNVDIVNINGVIFNGQYGNQALFAAIAAKEYDYITRDDFLIGQINSGDRFLQSQVTNHTNGITAINNMSGGSVLNTTINNIKNMADGSLLSTTVSGHTSSISGLQTQMTSRVTSQQLLTETNRITCIIDAVRAFHGHTYGCTSFTGETLIHTDEGIIPIKDVVPGMSVLVPKGYGKLTRIEKEVVLELRERLLPAGEPLVSIYLASEPSVVMVTPEHNFAARINGKLRLVPAGELKAGMMLYRYDVIAGKLAVKKMGYIMRVHQDEKSRGHLKVYSLTLPYRKYLVGPGVLAH